jgi:hypothetical protein
MSREIDISKQLSEEDRQYLLDRWDVTSLRRNMDNLGVDPAVSFRAESMSYDEYESALEADGPDAETPEAPAPEAVAGGSSDPVPASSGAQQAAGVERAASPGSHTEASPEVPGDFTSPRAYADESLASKQYEDWTNAQLTAEITKRNEMRVGDPDYADEAPMVTTGNKPDLVSRLVEDDEADAE